MPTPPASSDPTNLLLGLAWLGELDRAQIQRLWFPDKSESTVEKTLARLRRAGLISVRPWSLRDEGRGVTVPQLGRWSLTPRGQALIKTSAQYPARPAQPRRQGLIAHDARTTATIVRLIEIGRLGGLSGIFVGYELRLNPQERRPVCDALVVLQLGVFAPRALVPWSGDPAIADERRRRFAIEADNDTEPLAVIHAKALAYRRLAEDPAWRAAWERQYGPLPVPLWAAPTPERAAAIHEQWRRAWPEGRWLITSDAGLARNELTQWRYRAAQTIALSFAPAPPAPPAAAPVQAVAPAPVAATPVAAPPRPAPPDARVVIIAPPLAEPWPPALIAEERGQPVATALRLVPLLGAGLRLLGAGLRLPWRLLGALARWYAGLDYLLATRLRLLLFTLAVSAGGIALILHPPGWLAGPTPARPAPTIGVVVEAHAGPTPVAPTPAPHCPPARVTADGVNLRAGPGLQAAVLRKLRRDEALSVLDCGGLEQDGFTWWEVAGADGTRGWAATRWLESPPADPP